MEIVNVGQFQNLNRQKVHMGNYYHLCVAPKDDVKHIVPDVSRDIHWQQDYSSEHYDICS